MVQWNQLLAEKDSQILELQDKLDSLLQPRMNSARSREELEAIADSEGGLVAVTKQLKNISALLMVNWFLIYCFVKGSIFLALADPQNFSNSI